MFDRLRQLVLRTVRVPPAPEPPVGAPGSVRVFRAGRNFYRLLVLRWTLKQVTALAGIVWSVGFLVWLKDSDAARGEWWLLLVKIAEVAGVAFYLAQLPVTFAALRLGFELRWYVVTDRSLRIRSGVFTVQETTMSFANLQEVVVTQGPLERWLGLADVRVRSAGGGGSGKGHGAGGSGEGSLHEGIFEGVEDAAGIRDLMLARLRHYRDAGLGDMDDAGEITGGGPGPVHAQARPVAAAEVAGPAALAAARELLAEARALSAVVTRASP